MSGDTNTTGICTVEARGNDGLYCYTHCVLFLRDGTVPKSCRDTTWKTPSAAARSAAPSEEPSPRKQCQKVPHDNPSGGYLHDENDDSPYDVDGMLYCGRCHVVVNQQTGRCQSSWLMGSLAQSDREAAKLPKFAKDINAAHDAQYAPLASSAPRAVTAGTPTELPFADDGLFLRGIADFLEAHGRDEGGFGSETRAEFQSDADRLREMAARLRSPGETPEAPVAWAVYSPTGYLHRLVRTAADADLMVEMLASGGVYRVEPLFRAALPSDSSPETKTDG